jgi:hypothetical protein
MQHQPPDVQAPSNAPISLASTAPAQQPDMPKRPAGSAPGAGTSIRKAQKRMTGFFTRVQDSKPEDTS